MAAIDDTPLPRSWTKTAEVFADAIASWLERADEKGEHPSSRPPSP